MLRGWSLCAKRSLNINRLLFSLQKLHMVLLGDGKYRKLTKTKKIKKLLRIKCQIIISKIIIRMHCYWINNEKRSLNWKNIYSPFIFKPCWVLWRKSINHGLCLWDIYSLVWDTRLGIDCGSDHELLIAKFRQKLKKVEKTTRPFRYDLNQIPMTIQWKWEIDLRD